MGIIEAILSIYFILLLIRVMIPDTGQMTFNHPYRVVVKLTAPLVDNLGKIIPDKYRGISPLLGMLLPIIIQAAIYAGSTDIRARVFDSGLSQWIFFSDRPFWALGKSVIFFLVLAFRLYALLIFIALSSHPATSSDQVSRLIKGMVRPLERLRPLRLIVPVILIFVFTLILTVIWKIYLTIGWIGEEKMILFKAGLDSIVLLVQLSSLIIIVIVLQAVISWFVSSRRYGVPLFWFRLLTDPFIRPFRRLNLIFGGFDMAPLAAIIALFIVRNVIIRIIMSIYPS